MRRTALVVFLLTAALAACGEQQAERVEQAAAEAAAEVEARAVAEAKELEAREIAIDAYVYAYPLVTMELTRRVSVNVEAPEGTKAPMGHFARLREYPNASFRTVTAPNADTLYTIAWLDVSAEPWIVSLPDMKDRYFLFPMLDGWTNVFQVPGKRTTGTAAQTYAITGPGWSGSLPDGVTRYDSPTAMVWILGRIYCTGTPEDYAAVHALQDQVSAVPLSAYGKPYTPPPGKVDPAVDMETPVREQVNAMDALAYFTLVAELLKANPPAPEDAPMVARLAKIGIVPGEDFDASKLESPVARGLASAPEPAQEKVMDWMKEGIVAGDLELEGGWLFTTKTGVYGTNYRQRAFITAIGLGANRPQDAVYPTSEGPGVLGNYDGAKRYVMRFEKGRLPPVNGFWSLTMYDAEYFFVENPLNRYTLSQRNALVANPDGSIDLYVQHESPGKDKESNWLPAPSGPFILMMRLYWPREEPPSLLDGTWSIPEVKAAS
ncbi:MAG TPA: DUF1254 domain-containing protein [Myxococcota bacterium]|nr:DUF1254 domain-containing protein [Myxococcota bacterium]